MTNSHDFPVNAPVANPVFFRTYSRIKPDANRESWGDVCDRTIRGLAKLGKLTPEETQLVYRQQKGLIALTSGRWLWVGGCEWLEKPENYPGAYNCSSTTIDSWESFALIMGLAMQGCGTGAILEPRNTNKLPPIRNKLSVSFDGKIGETHPDLRNDETEIAFYGNTALIRVGDSREGWVDSYLALLYLASNEVLPYREINVVVDLKNVRPQGERLKGFGGVANPSKLPGLYTRIADILNGALWRRLTSVECCLIIDEASVVVVAGNVRRSSGMRQFNAEDLLGIGVKDDLWQQDDQGNWRIDPKRDALRMANHTRVFHHKPSLEECIESVRKQYHSGEGAIQWAGEAIARANADILDTPEKKRRFLEQYSISQELGEIELTSHMLGGQNREEIDYRMAIYGLNPCGEVILQNNFCNLSEIHLNRIDPLNSAAQDQAFKAGALSVSALLHHRFTEPRYQRSRELDPIVGVSFTGLFDFFVNAFGVDWLKWWDAGRLETDQGLTFKQREAEYLNRWREIVHQTVWEYCDRHNLKRPNRCTTVQPSGTKSLLTGASPGWHPPKSQRFIRRVTFAKNDPVALACIDYGYNVVPSQSDKDQDGNLLNDPFSEYCTEWLVEIPVAVSWADLPGADQIDISQFSALAQFDFYMQVQKHYTRHNTSATIELRENEIEALGTRIYEAIRDDEGYISAALLARFDARQSFPRFPFEPISKSVHKSQVNDVLFRRKSSNFHNALKRHDHGEELGPAGCDSDKCLFPVKK